MKIRPRPSLILIILFVYVLLQFTWWEVLLVRQNGTITSEREKLAALQTTNRLAFEKELEALRHRKKMQTLMIVGEGTIFLLILLYGVSRIHKAHVLEESLLRNQRNFILSVTHELKTPIAATKLQLQTLARQKLDPPTQSDLIRKALDENERLDALIDRVLVAGRLESGGLQLSLRRMDLSALVDEVCDRYFRDAGAQGHLRVDTAQPVTAEIDPQVFPSVIINLVENALKYGGDPPKVEIAVTTAGNAPVITVADNGQGIPSSDRNRIFERFYRGGNESTRRVKGTGLGLYIVRYIVKAHQGTVTVSPNVPCGSVFHVRLNA